MLKLFAIYMTLGQPAAHPYPVYQPCKTCFQADYKEPRQPRIVDKKR